MLKSWTPARARGTSTAQWELDTSGKQMRALGILVCAYSAGDAPVPRVEGQRPMGIPKGGTPLSRALFSTMVPPIGNDTLVPGSHWGDET